MSDLINRQVAINYIKQQRARRFVACTIEEVMITILEELPSVQQEIIRCKDCKYYGRADKRRFYRGMDCLNKHIDTIIPDKDYCSKAERREDG